ncbi:MAG: diguanylate cyclase [Rhodospirillales bacterium]|nr:diguanylate cyclase [Rhodospirillales bacterium]
MDVNQTNGVAPVHADGRQHNHGREHAADPSDQKKGGKNPASGSWRDQDAVNIDHQLLDALTPEVQAIIDQLNGEIEPLRGRLAHAEQQVEDLKGALARHAFLNIPNRVEILHDLDHVISHRESLSMASVLVLLHVANADSVRRKFGRRNLERYLIEFCRRVTDSKHPTDVFGCIGGNDFALILLGADMDQAGQSLAALTDRVLATPIDLAGTQVSVELISGCVELGQVSSVESAISAADQLIAAAG